MESDVCCFRRRATEENAAALKALHWQARQRHLEMAERYDELASALAARHHHFGLSPADESEADSG